MVSKRARVPFSVGATFKDDIMCDVVVMDITSCWVDLGSMTAT